MSRLWASIPTSAAEVSVASVATHNGKYESRDRHGRLWRARKPAQFNLTIHAPKRPKARSADEPVNACPGNLRNRQA